MNIKLLIVFCILFLSLVARSVSATGDPIAVYHMDNNWADSSGNGNNGTPGGNVTFGTAKIGSASGSFSGITSGHYAGDWVALPTSVFNYPDKSVGLWFNSRISTYGNIHAGLSGTLFASTATHTGRFYMYLDSTNIGCMTGASNTDHILQGFQDNTWYYMVMTYDNTTGNASCYVNGQLKATFHDPISYPSIATVSFGSWANGYSDDFNGLIDEVSIWNRVLSAEEIADLYSAEIVNYTLTLTPNNGVLSGNSFSSVYAGGSVVTFTAVPTTGWVFDHWSGDATGSANPLTMTMDADKSVIANFVPASPVSLIGLENTTASLVSGALNFFKNLFKFR